MATYYVSHRGNRAMQEEIWSLTVPEAQAALPFLPTHTGSYWERVLLRPIRRARRAKAGTLHVCTSARLASVQESLPMRYLTLM